MPWVRAELKGQKVFARASADGTLLVEAGRVQVLYRQVGSKEYRASAANLVVAGGDLLPDDACSVATPGESGSRSSGKIPTKSAAAAKSGSKIRRAAGTPSAGTSLSPAGKGSSGSQPHAAPTSAPADCAIAYADGACSGNPGPAGLGVVVLDGPDRIELYESLGEGTNNVAELSAIDRVLDLVPDEKRPIAIYTDSGYAIGVLSKGWKAKANGELVTRIRGRLARRHDVRFVHVRGHAGIELNERADELAREAVRTGRKHQTKTKVA